MIFFFLLEQICSHLHPTEIKTMNLINFNRTFLELVTSATAFFFQFHQNYYVTLFFESKIGIAISHEKRENGKFVDEKFLTGKSDEKNGKLSSLKLGIFG